MGQIAAALLFAVAAGLGITVILAMLKMNGNAILSAFAGEGAFPVAAGPATGPSQEAVRSRRPMTRREAPRPARTALTTQSLLSRAA